MTRTASMGSRVPPAVTSTRTPARSSSGPSTLGRGGHDRRRDRRGGPRRRRHRRGARRGVDHVHAPSAQRGEVVLHRRVLPHLGVHRGRDEHRRPGGEQRGGEQVVGDAGGVLARAASRWPGDHDTRSADWPSTRVRDRLRRRRRSSEVRAAGSDASAENVSAPTNCSASCGEHGRTCAPGVDEPAADLDGLVGGDAAAHAEHDATASHRGQGYAPVGATRGLRRRRRRRRRRRGLGGSDLGELLFGQRDRFDLADLDLLDGDRERLARHRGDLRRDDLAEALAELVVVVVDLAGPHRRQRDQRELGVDPLEQVLHAGVMSDVRRSAMWDRSSSNRRQRAHRAERNRGHRGTAGPQDTSHLGRPLVPGRR